MDPIVLLVVAIILLVLLLVTCVKIVPQATEYVIEFLGKYRTTWQAGLHFKIPLLERVVKIITLKEQVLDSAPQPVITMDNVTMQIDTVVFYRIFDSKLYTYGAVNPIMALENMTATTLRNLVGELDLDGTLTSRDMINGKMTSILDEATDSWGIKVNRVELKNIIPPKEIQNAMEKQMKAERERRETLLQAQGHKEAIVTRAEGEKQAMVLAAEGERDARIARAEGEARALTLQKEAEAQGLIELKAAAPDAAVLELKKYEALIRLADGRAAKIIIPTDVVDTTRKTALMNEVAGIGSVTDVAPEPAAPEPPKDVCCDDEDEEE